MTEAENWCGARDSRRLRPTLSCECWSPCRRACWSRDQCGCWSTRFTGLSTEFIGMYSSRPCTRSVTRARTRTGRTARPVVPMSRFESHVLRRARGRLPRRCQESFTNSLGTVGQVAFVEVFRRRPLFNASQIGSRADRWGQSRRSEIASPFHPEMQSVWYRAGARSVPSAATGHCRDLYPASRS